MKTYNQFLETPFSEDKKWIQKATKNMRKDKPCTGEKFGSETCPPGSKRYNLAKTFKKMAKEEVVTEADPRLAIYQSGMTDASRVKGRVGKAVDKVKDKVKKVLGKKDKVSSHLDRYRFQSGLDNYLKSKVKKEEVVIDESEKVAQGAQKRAEKLGAKRRQASYKKYGSNVGSPGKSERAGYNLARKARSAEASPETQVTKKKKPAGFDTGQQGHARKRDEKTSVGKSGKTLKTPKYKLSFKDRQTHHTRSAWERRDPKKNPKHTAHKSVKEDKAYDYVVSQLKKKYGDGVLTKRDKIKPQSPAEKAKVRAHQAKVDKENAAERAKDPSQGRYPKGYSNRGSD